MNNLPRRMDQFGNKLSALISLKRLKMVLRFHTSCLHICTSRTRVACRKLRQLDDTGTLAYITSELCFQQPKRQGNILPSRFNIQDLWHQVPDPTERYTDILLRGLAYESHSEKLSVRHSVVSVLRLLERGSPTSVYSVLPRCDNSFCFSVNTFSTTHILVFPRATQVSAYRTVPLITFD